MAEERSEKCRWKSRFAVDTWISSSQYLAENMCDRQARKKKTTLPFKFWDKEISPTWHREFLMQLRHANSLLKLYSVEAIVAALRSPKGKNVFSLGAKWLDPIIQEEQRRFDVAQEKQAVRLAKEETQPVVASNIPEAPRPSFTNHQSILSKLRDLDG